ncbi:hypothetical protein V6N12_055486 [Hibiscus sabdariffa]|uniref:Uncharacterized protein n=1 Tax=Hibiscus sabdariffa TaxID=183260 RepID=A0ABR2BTU6_9ROSI
MATFSSELSSAPQNMQHFPRKTTKPLSPNSNNFTLLLPLPMEIQAPVKDTANLPLMEDPSSGSFHLCLAFLLFPFLLYLQALPVEMCYVKDKYSNRTIKSH